MGRGGQEEGGEDRHDEAGQDQGPGRQRGGEEHAGEPVERLLKEIVRKIFQFLSPASQEAGEVDCRQ